MLESSELVQASMMQKHNTFSPSRGQETQSSITWKRGFGGIWEWKIQHPKRLGIEQQMEQRQSGRKTSAVDSFVFLVSHSYGLMLVVSMWHGQPFLLSSSNTHPKTSFGRKSKYWKLDLQFHRPKLLLSPSTRTSKNLREKLIRTYQNAFNSSSRKVPLGVWLSWLKTICKLGKCITHIAPKVLFKGAHFYRFVRRPKVHHSRIRPPFIKQRLAFRVASPSVASQVAGSRSNAPDPISSLPG